MEPYSHPAFYGSFGIARRDITPPVSIYARNWGLADHDQAESIHQPLTLTALIISDRTGGEALAIVALDLGWWRSLVEEEALAQAGAAAGFPPSRCLIALSHTHSGPSFCPNEANKPGGELIPNFLQELAGMITAALREAHAGMTHGVLETIEGTCPLAANRDLYVEGRPVVGWNPAAEADQTLLFGRITTASGQCLATLVNYACHPTILGWENRTLSPDFIGSMREIVERETQAPVLFLQGASGDLAARHQYTGDLRVAERAGRQLGHAVLSLWFQMLPSGTELFYAGIVESGAPLALWRHRPLPPRPNDRLYLEASEILLPVSPALPTAQAIEDTLKTTTERVQTERLHRLRMRREAVGDGPEVGRPSVMARLGSILLVAVADEVYSEMQTALRAKSKGSPLFVMTLVNRNVGYLVPQKFHSCDHYASAVSPFAPGSYEMMRSFLEQKIERLSPQSPPGIL